MTIDYASNTTENARPGEHRRAALRREEHRRRAQEADQGSRRHKCVDVSGDDIGGNLAVVQLWDCQNVVTGAPGGHPEARDQQWTYNPADQSVRTIGRCLDVIDNATTMGAGIQLHDCNGVGGRHWVPQANGALLNPASNYCLDAPNGETTNGTLLHIWDCNGAPAQKFILN